MTKGDIRANLIKGVRGIKGNRVKEEDLQGVMKETKKKQQHRVRYVHILCYSGNSDNT